MQRHHENSTKKKTRRDTEQKQTGMVVGQKQQQYIVYDAGRLLNEAPHCRAEHPLLRVEILM